MQPTMTIGQAYGKYLHHQKQSTFFGVCVKIVYQLVFVFKIGVFRVLCLVLYVIMISRMIGMLFLRVKLVSKVDKAQA
jgi:hypothetical protein